MTTTAATRNVTVASAVGNKVKKIALSLDVTTWGGLKPLLSAEGFSITNTEAVCKATQATLKRDDAMLPTEDFVLYLVPTKNESGLSPDAAAKLGAEIAAAIIKAASIASDEDVDDLKESLIEEIAEFFEVDVEALEAENTTVPSTGTGVSAEETELLAELAAAKKFK